MKNYALSAAILAMMTGSAMAITVDGVVDAGYGAAKSSDPTTPAWAAPGDEGGAADNQLCDLKDLFITNGGTALYVALTIDNAIATPTDWGKYCINISSPGITSTGGPHADAWGRNVTLAATTNYQFHCWVDGPGGGGFSKWNNTTPGWDAGTGASFVTASGSPSVVEISIPLADLGITTSQSVSVSAWVTGGGNTDNAQDAIPSTNPNATDWAATSSLVNEVTYNLVAPSAVEDWSMF